MDRDIKTIAAATELTIVILALGYLSFGVWTMLIFSSGFGLGLVLWLLSRGEPGFAAIKWPFLIAFLLFIVHRVEEYGMKFFDELGCGDNLGFWDSLW